MPSLGARDTQVWIANKSSGRLFLLVSPTPDQVWSGSGAITLEVSGSAPATPAVVVKVPRAINSARTLYKAVQELRQSALIKTAADLQQKVWWTEDLLPAANMADAWRAELRKLLAACAAPIEPGAAVRINEDRLLTLWKTLNAGYTAGVENCTSAQLTLVDESLERIASFSTELDRSWLIGPDGVWRAESGNLWRIQLASPEFKSWDAGPESPTAPANAGPGSAVLRAGQSLAPNQSLRSPNGQYLLVYQPDGNLALYDRASGRTLWASMTMLAPALAAFHENGNLTVFHATHGNAFDQVAFRADKNGGRVGPGLGARLAVEDSGAAVIYGRDNAVLWSSATSGDVAPQAVSTGNKVRSPNGRYQLVEPQAANLVAALWPAVPAPARPRPERTGPATAVLLAGESLKPGEFLQSSDGRHRLLYQNDGNLTLSLAGQTIWATGTSGAVGQVIVGGPQGFAVYGATGSGWVACASGGLAGAGTPDRLVLEDRGELVLYARDNTALWSSKRPAQPAPAAQPAPTAVGPSLPAPWQARDIGTVGLAGSAAHDNGRFTVIGSGGDIWGMADSFRYAYQPIRGDMEIRARVASLGNTHPWARAGVMIRETLEPGSMHAMVVVTPGNGVRFEARSVTSGATGGPSTLGPQAPLWVRLVRSGNTFTGQYSLDGTTWVTLGSSSISMGVGAHAGLCVASTNNAALNTTTFEGVALNAQPAPVVQTPAPVAQAPAPPQPAPVPQPVVARAGALPDPWLTQDVPRGYLGVAGSTAFDNGVFSVKGSAAAGSQWETFRYVYQFAQGDCEVLARVTGVDNTGPSAVAGVMIRDSFDTRAPCVRVVVTPASGVLFQTVGASMAVQTQNSAAAQRAPCWVRLVRSGDTFSGFYSTDGATWVALGSFTVAMNFLNGVSLGMFVTSQNPAVLHGATFDNVTAVARPPQSSLPAPWQTRNIGAVRTPGRGEFSAGVFTLTGAGDGFSNETSDAFRFVYQMANGDCEIRARVVSMPVSNVWANAGVMIRETLDADSRCALVVLNPARFDYALRASPGSGFQPVGGAGLKAPPAWVRLTRRGNTFTAYESSDGVAWNTMRSWDMTMGSRAFVGLMMSSVSYERMELTTATFDNVSVG